ncbi:hypothetical protein OCHUTO_0035 [Orientia chuto str. Dubai]|uniref:Uncharacterized protein n=1 Tax=Orientia chuto str. Dubai TaxID=1359168 RepID=A0A0F3MSB8_9RICK|nr:hypothetical protein [Candidatus Orientia mediorientalis]KJV57509.1 hypothetical protein OCHUTO_0035 [Orientia chuto str. Dubai]
MAQSAFNRKIGEERGEINAQSWMKKYKKEYLKIAEALQLIDREKNTKHQNYNAAWIAGASCISTISSIIDYYYTISNIMLKLMVK